MAIVYNTSVPLNGLVTYVDAANIRSYPGTGNTWFDLSGNGNHFTMVGALSFSSKAFTSTASTANYFIRNPFAHPTSACTVEMWCLTDVGSSLDALWSYTITGNDNHNLLYDQTNLTLYGPEAASIIRSGVNIADGTWKQIVRTSDRATGAEILYVNGTQVFTTTANAGTNFTSGGSLMIAQEQDSVGGGLDATQALEGRFSVFKVYNRVLSSSEIRQSFEAFRGRYGI